MPKKLRAEVISIGDEMTSGQRLDTNSKWLSEQLGELGVEVAFHSTVGDDLQDNVDVFRIAINRADIVVATGGLGPTQDDLTRLVIAEVTGCELTRHEHVVVHIRKIFEGFGREMPANNLVQADFPSGATIIDNPEGTAPGIDMVCKSKELSLSRVFALPGVPAEMKQMWQQHVLHAVKELTGRTGTIVHHVVRCFGAGESQTEQMMPGLFQRGREPRVGITASRATISLRISARGNSESDCRTAMQPTIDEIHETLGDLVFGADEQELQDVVVELLSRRKSSVAIVDFGLLGDVARAILSARPSDCKAKLVSGSLVFEPEKSKGWYADKGHPDFCFAAEKIRTQFDAEFGISIGPIKKLGTPESTFVATIVERGRNSRTETFGYRGHSDFRHERSVKQVLNQFRLMLLGR